jgi:hypothetical protein
VFVVLYCAELCFVCRAFMLPLRLHPYGEIDLLIHNSLFA